MGNVNVGMAIPRYGGTRKTPVEGNEQKDPSVGRIGLEDIGRPE